MPLLVTQNYGRGRTAVFATGGDWRWQMLQPLEDMTHEMFWRQLLRWLVSDTPTRVVASTPKQVLSDEGGVHAAGRGPRHYVSAGRRRQGGSAHRGAGRLIANRRVASRSAGARRLYGRLERGQSRVVCGGSSGAARARRNWAAT